MSDLISRQAAIDLIKNDAFWVQYAWGGRGHKPEMEMVDDLVESIIKQMKESVVSRLEQMPSAQPEQRWIPCSERLPEKYGMYLVTMTEKAKAEDLGFDVDDIQVSKMRYNSNGWQLPRHIPAWINDVITDEVIAWQPLPEPYAERRTDD